MVWGLEARILRLPDSRHIPDIKSVAKGLKPRLFPLSVIPAKAGNRLRAMDPRLREDDSWLFFYHSASLSTLQFLTLSVS